MKTVKGLNNHSFIAGNRRLISLAEVTVFCDEINNEFETSQKHNVLVVKPRGPLLSLCRKH